MVVACLPDSGCQNGENSKERQVPVVLTGIKLLAGSQQSAPVVHGQLIALLGLALALDRVGDIDLEVLLGGDDANGARGQGGEEQGCLHGGEKKADNLGKRRKKMRRTRRCAEGSEEMRASLGEREEDEEERGQ